MGTTTRFALPYPELTDAPDSPAQVAALAVATDNLLARALPCLSSARPTGVADGFLIRETDTGTVMVWNGSAWVAVAAAGGGGGAGTVADATFSATSVQSIPNSASTVVAFGNDLKTHGLVVKTSQGAGHKFTLGQSGVWTVAATGRFATTASAGERTFDLLAGSTVLAKAGGPGAGVPYTASLSCTRYLASGTAVTVVAFQGTGAALPLEPQAGDWCHIDLVCLG